jgi:hypothetical protein
MLVPGDRRRIAAVSVVTAPPSMAIVGLGEQFSQYCSRSSLHEAQRRQLSTMGPTPTICPGLKLETPVPTAVTQPTISWPGTQGKGTRGHSPRTLCRSEWQTPQYRTSIATSLAPGSRRSMVWGTSGPRLPRAHRSWGDCELRCCRTGRASGRRPPNPNRQSSAAHGSRRADASLRAGRPRRPCRTLCARKADRTLRSSRVQHRPTGRICWCYVFVPDDTDVALRTEQDHRPLGVRDC